MSVAALVEGLSISSAGKGSMTQSLLADQLSAAFVVHAHLMSSALKANGAADPAMAPAVLKEMGQDMSRYWFSEFSPTVADAFRLSASDLDEGFVNAVAGKYTGALAQQVNEVSDRAFLEGYNAALNKGWDRAVAWQRVADAYGLDPVQMRSWITAIPEQQGYATEITPEQSIRRRDELLLKRATRLGEHEVRTLRHTGRQTMWLQMMQQGSLPPNTMKQWVTAADERVCPECGPLDGKMEPLDGAFNGSFMPPLHINCRCEVILVDPSGESAVIKSHIRKSLITEFSKARGADKFDRDRKGQFSDTESRGGPKGGTIKGGESIEDTLKRSRELAERIERDNPSASPDDLYRIWTHSEGAPYTESVGDQPGTDEAWEYFHTSRRQREIPPGKYAIAGLGEVLAVFDSVEEARKFSDENEQLMARFHHHLSEKAERVPHDSWDIIIAPTDSMTTENGWSMYESVDRAKKPMKTPDRPPDMRGEIPFMTNQGEKMVEVQGWNLDKPSDESTLDEPDELLDSLWKNGEQIPSNPDEWLQWSKDHETGIPTQAYADLKNHLHNRQQPRLSIDEYWEARQAYNDREAEWRSGRLGSAQGNSEQELAALKQQRKDAAKEIGVAAEWGDLRENAEWHSARERAEQLDAKIAQLENGMPGTDQLDLRMTPEDRAEYESMNLRTGPITEDEAVAIAAGGGTLTGAEQEKFKATMPAPERYHERKTSEEDYKKYVQQQREAHGFRHRDERRGNTMYAEQAAQEQQVYQRGQRMNWDVVFGDPRAIGADAPSQGGGFLMPQGGGGDQPQAQQVEERVPEEFAFLVPREDEDFSTLQWREPVALFEQLPSPQIARDYLYAQVAIEAEQVGQENVSSVMAGEPLQDDVEALEIHQDIDELLPDVKEVSQFQSALDDLMVDAKNKAALKQLGDTNIAETPAQSLGERQQEVVSRAQRREFERRLSDLERRTLVEVDQANMQIHVSDVEQERDTFTIGMETNGKIVYGGGSGQPFAEDPLEGGEMLEHVGLTEPDRVEFNFDELERTSNTGETYQDPSTHVTKPMPIGEDPAFRTSLAEKLGREHVLPTTGLLEDVIASARSDQERRQNEVDQVIGLDRDQVDESDEIRQVVDSQPDMTDEQRAEYARRAAYFTVERPKPQPMKHSAEYPVGSVAGWSNSATRGERQPESGKLGTVSGRAMTGSEVRAKSTPGSRVFTDKAKLVVGEMLERELAKPNPDQGVIEQLQRDLEGFSKRHRISPFGVRH